MQVWAAPLQGGGRGVVLFNRQFPAEGVTNHTMVLRWTTLGYAPTVQVVAQQASCQALCEGRLLAVPSWSVSWWRG